jgi:hypothetical protein
MENAMKDLLLKIADYFPRYINGFSGLVSRPKRFLAERNCNADDTLAESLRFLAISIALISAISPQRLAFETDLWTDIGTKLFLTILGTSLVAVALLASWKLVAGKATFKSMFVTYSYLTAVFIVLMNIIYLLAYGIVKVFEPDIISQMIKSGVPLGVPVFLKKGTTSTTVAAFVLLVGNILLAIWFFISWGAFRQLNKVGRVRSFLAFVVCSILAIPMSLVLFFIGAAMSKYGYL